MGENEAETVKTLTSYRKIMAELIQQHPKLTGGHGLFE